MEISVSGLVMSMALLVLGFWMMSWGSDVLGPWLALCGGIGILLTLLPVDGKPKAPAPDASLERRLRELDELLERGVLEPEERDRKRAALLEAA